MNTRIVRCFAVVFTLAALAYMAVSTGQARNANAASGSAVSSSQTGGTGVDPGQGGTGIVTSPSLDNTNSSGGGASSTAQSNNGSQSSPAAPAAGGCCG